MALDEAKGQRAGVRVFAVVEESGGRTDRRSASTARCSEGGTVHLEADIVLLRRSSANRSRSTASVAPIRDRSGAQPIGAVARLPGHEPRAPIRGAPVAPGEPRPADRACSTAREFENRLRARARAARRRNDEPPRGAVSRPRPVQGRQRHLRPRGGRRAAAPGQRAAAAHGCAQATRSRAWAATSSACCSSTARRSRRCASPKALRKSDRGLPVSPGKHRSFTIGVSIGLVNVDRRAAYACRRCCRRGRRRVLSRQGQGPQPRAGLPRRATARWRCATAKWSGSNRLQRRAGRGPAS